VVALVTDSNHYTATSAALAFTVYADPSVNVSVSPSAVDVGLTTTLNATATGGSGGFSYVWQGLPTGCAGGGAVVNCTPTKSGPFEVRVTATDSNGEPATSHAISLVVAPPVTGSLSASLGTPTIGESVVFNATGSGGTGGLSYAWTFGDGSMATGASVSHAYTRSGAFTVTVWINDSIGGSTVKTLNVVVSPSAPTGGTTGGSGSVPASELWILAAVAILGWVVVALLVISRRPPARAAPSATRVTPVEPAPAAPTAPAPPTEEDEE
jgi:hypothetical protein